MEQKKQATKVEKRLSIQMTQIKSRIPTRGGNCEVIELSTKKPIPIQLDCSVNGDEDASFDMVVVDGICLKVDLLHSLPP